MKQSNERRTTAGQSNSAQKPQKHDANLQKNSTLYFQIGLIVCLLVVYGLFQMRFEKKLPKIDDRVVCVEQELTVVPDNFKILEEVEAQKKEQKKMQKLLMAPPIVKPNDFMEIVPTEVFTESTTTKIAKMGEINVPEKPGEEPEIFNIIGVEKVPIYPGCESAKSNDERRKCMSDKLTTLIQKKFNPYLAQELGLSGKQKIDVQFTIDKTGNITDIKTRAPRTQLENETLRVLEKVPTMKPGLQRAKPVSVIYSMPIILMVQ